MKQQTRRSLILEGRTYLGIEFGSTRIKAILIGPDHEPMASGEHTWENRYEHGIWTYGEQEIWDGLRSCYQSLVQNVQAKYGVAPSRYAAMGISAMMHGYLPFDSCGNLLTPFRTWRNTITAEAAEQLSERFHFNIPQRWSIAHLYQAILNQEAHVGEIAYLTTLAGYVHWKLTGRKVLGIGDASGMFPIDSAAGDFDEAMLRSFEELAATHGFGRRIRDLLPEVLPAGAEAGNLTEAGARLLDPTGVLGAGIPLCPPEGDAGTGMTATNSVAPRTGNVSAGTSIFAMVVLEKPLSRAYPEIDMVTTPSGAPVAMAHCNNGTSELSAWAGLFQEVCGLMGAETDLGTLLTALNRKSLEGDADCGGLMAYNYLSGEHVVGLESGRPLFVRGPESRFNLANFMRVQLYATLAALKLGMEILEREQVALDRLLGHGGLFKTPGVGQRYLAAAVGTPVSVMETAGEGGAWGMALLAAYRVNRRPEESLEQYLSERVFVQMRSVTLEPQSEDAAGFQAFLTAYRRGLAVEKTAVQVL